MAIQRLQGSEERLEGVFYEYDNEDTPLGEGAMGRVYVGVQVNSVTHQKVPVAIKAIFDNIPEAVVERARREASVRVENPYLLRMLGFIEQPFTVTYNGHTATVMRYFVVMELLQGVTLYQLIQGHTADSLGNEIPAVRSLYDSYVGNKNIVIQSIISKVLKGVVALHNEGYIHRDIDPTNIMITSDGHVKLIDFGICKKLDTLSSTDRNLTATGLFMGKVDYASPELIIGDVLHQNQTTDIYAVGILLFQLCTGHLPFPGSDNEVLLGHMRKKIPLKELKNSPFRKIIAKATQKSQIDRYPHADSMLEAISRIDFEKSNHHRIIVGAVLLLCLIVGCIVLVAYLREPIHQQKRVVEMKIDPHGSIDIHSRMKEIRNRLWSRDTAEVYSAFQELSRMAKEENDIDAMFEYAMSFSVANEDFDMPIRRQCMLKIEADIGRAKLWLRRVLDRDREHYRAVYWLLVNLIAEKQKNEQSVVIDEIYDNFDKFDEITANQDNDVVNKYKDAVKHEKERLKKRYKNNPKVMKAIKRRTMMNY